MPTLTFYGITRSALDYAPKGVWLFVQEYFEKTTLGDEPGYAIITSDERPDWKEVNLENYLEGFEEEGPTDVLSWFKEEQEGVFFYQAQV